MWPLLRAPSVGARAGFDDEGQVGQARPERLAPLAGAVFILAMGQMCSGRASFPDGWRGHLWPLGIVALAGPAGFIAFVAFPFWALAVSVVLYQRSDRAAVPPAPVAAEASKLS
jgi:hypothetical protein